MERAVLSGSNVASVCARYPSYVVVMHSAGAVNHVVLDHKTGEIILMPVPRGS